MLPQQNILWWPHTLQIHSNLCCKQYCGCCVAEQSPPPDLEFDSRTSQTIIKLFYTGYTGLTKDTSSLILFIHALHTIQASWWALLGGSDSNLPANFPYGRKPDRLQKTHAFSVEHWFTHSTRKNQWSWKKRTSNYRGGRQVVQLLYCPSHITPPTATVLFVH